MKKFILFNIFLFSYLFPKVTILVVDGSFYEGEILRKEKDSTRILVDRIYINKDLVESMEKIKEFGDFYRVFLDNNNVLTASVLFLKNGDIQIYDSLIVPEGTIISKPRIKKIEKIIRTNIRLYNGNNIIGELIENKNKSYYHVQNVFNPQGMTLRNSDITSIQTPNLNPNEVEKRISENSVEWNSQWNSIYRKRIWNYYEVGTYINGGLNHFNELREFYPNLFGTSFLIRKGLDSFFGFDERKWFVPGVYLSGSYLYWYNAYFPIHNFRNSMGFILKLNLNPNLYMYTGLGYTLDYLNSNYFPGFVLSGVEQSVTFSYRLRSLLFLNTVVSLNLMEYKFPQNLLSLGVHYEFK